MGKWKVESDFEHVGLRCVVIMTEMGYRCGYVGITQDHPLFGLDYGKKSKYLKFTDIAEDSMGQRGIFSLVSLSFDENKEFISPDCYFDVHGSITYAGGGKGSTYPVDSDLWWFGYDCAHAGDDKDLSILDERYREVELQMRSEIVYDRGVVRSNEYCVNECKSLAEQLSKIRKEN
jgi:hypothetical protein